MTSPTPPSPESAEPVLDLESQLDALLAQIEQSEPGILQPPPASSTPAPPQAVTPVASSSTTSSAEDDSAAASVLDDELSFSPEDFIAPSDPLPRTAAPQASPAAADNSTGTIAAASAASVAHEQSQEQAQASADDHDELGLDLAAQIQQLLDHARDDERPTAAATSAAAAASQGLVPENLNSEDLAPAAPAAAAQASQAAMTLEDIDHMLSEEAEDAVSGEFETPTQVLAETAAPASDTTSNQDASHAEADDLVEGSFQATQDILPSSASTTASSATPPQASQPAASSSSTTKQEQPLTPAAAAVARELDEQPENDPVRRSRIAPELDIHESPHHHTGNRFALLTTLLSQLPQALRHLCAFISRPLASATPQTRDMVGYVGLITLFWGTVTVAVKIFFATNN